MVSLSGKSLIRNLVAAALILCGFCASASAWTEARKRKLDEIESQLKSAREQIRLYEQMEKSLARRTQSLKRDRDERDRDMSRLRRKLSSARANRIVLQNHLAALTQTSGLWRLEMEREIRIYSDGLWAGSEGPEAQGLWGDLLVQRTVLQQAALLQRLNGMGQATVHGQQRGKTEESRILTQSAQAKAQALLAEERYQDAMAKIAQAQRAKASAQARAQELEASARALSKLIRQLRQRQRHAPTQVAPWTALKNSLPWPVSGSVIERFGRQRDLETGVWMLNRGLLIATKPEAAVLAVGDARVIYAGSFRSYGQVLILDHGGDFFSIYGHLGQIVKSQGQNVKAGDVIARVGPLNRGDQNGVYLEIRRGTKALNPLDWLQKSY